MIRINKIKNLFYGFIVVMLLATNCQSQIKTNNYFLSILKKKEENLHIPIILNNPKNDAEVFSDKYLAIDVEKIIIDNKVELKPKPIALFIDEFDNSTVKLKFGQSFIYYLITDEYISEKHDWTIIVCNNIKTLDLLLYSIPKISSKISIQYRIRFPSMNCSDLYIVDIILK